LKSSLMPMTAMCLWLGSEQMLTGTYDMTSGMDMEANLEEFALQSQWCTHGGKERFCLNVARFVKKVYGIL
jgi:hypothetical protein